MELILTRDTFSNTTTIGSLAIDGTFFCYTLEPFDRKLTDQMTLQEIKNIKVPNKTAIPSGRYEVTKYPSPKWGENVPLLNSIPDFADVEIHVGNFAANTDGCILLGTERGVDEVLNSRLAISAFYPKVFAVIDNGEAVWISCVYAAVPDLAQNEEAEQETDVAAQ